MKKYLWTSTLNILIIFTRYNLLDSFTNILFSYGIVVSLYYVDCNKKKLFFNFLYILILIWWSNQIHFNQLQTMYESYRYVYTPIYMIKHTWQSMKLKFSGELIVKKSVVSTMEHNNHQYWIQIRRCLLNISTT